MACNSKSNNRWHWLLWHNHFKNLMIRWKIHKWTVLYSLDEAKNSYFCQNSSKISMTNIQRTIKILLFSTPFLMYWQINLLMSHRCSILSLLLFNKSIFRENIFSNSPIPAAGGRVVAPMAPYLSICDSLG